MVYWLAQKQQDEFLRRISSGRMIFTHTPAGDQFFLVHSPEWQADIHTLGTYRPVQPLKALVFPPREMLGALFKPDSQPEVPERIVLGVKNCDLSSLIIQDQVGLASEPKDPYYALLRKKTLLVACDCTDARDVCFCTAIGEQPFAHAGFDLNLTPLPEGFIVESGSEAGQSLLSTVKDLLDPAGKKILAQREKQRAAMIKKVAALAASKGLHAGLDYSAAIRRTSNADFWKAFAKDCVECGACNFVCCTCHCFLLQDGYSSQQVPERLKQWDSCLYKNFARVAGGANPRSHRTERLYNRFDKKFVFFPQTISHYACDGCGRCVEACTGRIDIREVLKRATDEQ